MKPLFIILFWTIFIQYAQAQISWSPAQAMSSVYNQQQIIQVNSTGFQSLYQYKDEQFIFQNRVDYYNNDLQFEKSILVDSCYHQEKEGDYLGTFAWGEVLYSYFIIANVETKKEQFFVKNLNDNSPAILLFELNYNTNKSYKIATSPNQKKILIYHQVPTEKKENAKLHFVVIDSAFQIFTNNTIPLNQESSSFDIEDISDLILDDNGLIYLLYKRYKHQEKREEKKQGPLFVYSFIRLSKYETIKQLDTLQILTPQDSVVLIAASLFLEPQTNEVHCIGTFRGTNNSHALFDYNTSKNTTEQTTIINYPISFIDSSAASPRLSQKKKKMDLNNYKIKQILPQENGDKIILTEQVYSYVYFDKTEGRQVTHRLNNIAVMRVAADTIQWIQTLAKRQKSGGVGYSNIPLKLHSFYAYQKEEKIVVLYNDLESNLSINNEIELKPMDCNNPKEGSLIACQIRLTDGNLLSKTAAYDFKLSQGFFVPSSARITEDNVVYYVNFKPETQAKNNAEYRFGKIPTRVF